MVELRLHVPNACYNGEEPEYVRAQSWDELFQHERLQRWKTTQGFHRFSFSAPDLLMAEFQQGKIWWVVGYVNEVPSHLPIWEAKE